jgi:hypothetical protein
MTSLRSRGVRSAKHHHRTPNPIILSEENTILATVDRAIESSRNAQVIGRNGELPLRQFFNRYLPFTLRASTGHFITPRGQLSSQVDLLILDARYPLLAENPDGTVLAMLHAVLATFEVKTRMTARDMAKGWENARATMQLAAEVKGYGNLSGWTSVRTDALAYRLAQRLETTEVAYVDAATPEETVFDVYVLRLPPADQPPRGTLGAFLHMEPVDEPERFVPTCALSHTALSDVYYRLVQDSYYTLAQRNWSYGDIGRQVMDYMAWATLPWDEYEAMLRGQANERLHPTATSHRSQNNRKSSGSGRRG